MKIITEESLCCGCGACAQRCPARCITMREDADGFPRPVVDTGACTDCGLCTSVCPAIKRYEPHRPLKVLAARNPDESVRRGSSSGGVFSMLAEKVVDAGGVVFGAAFDDSMNVIHKAASTREELLQFRGSKYVQSVIGDCFSRAEEYLEEGREVLFSGTSCQIAGLRHFLGREYDNLLTVEIICHGVPSPARWRDLLASLPEAASANFRDKSTGWRNFSLTLTSADGNVLLSQKCSENAYMQDFLNDRIIRSSCFNCPARGGRSGSDIAIADYWGINKVAPQLDDNMGVSLILLETPRGAAFFDSLDFSPAMPPVETTYEQALARNRSLEFSPSIQSSFSGHIVDIVNRNIYDGEVIVRDGRILAVRRTSGISPDAPYIMPGFIDSHVHIESSMLTPAAFAAAVARHGTIGTVSDPHEIANVLGLEGVQFMLDNASESNFNFCFGAPSCVPSCSPDIETSGAVLDSTQVQRLLEMPQIAYLSEMMNFPGVLNSDPEVMRKIDCAKRLGKRIDGHAPGLLGEQRARYAAAGISTDHECATLEEGLSCIENGMSVLIREGSAARNYDALSPLIASHPGNVMFCSDDIHPGELLSGHIDAVVRRALADGYDLWSVLRAASLNPQRHYGLNWGLLQEGDPANFILVDSPDASMRVIDSIINGQSAADLPRVEVKDCPNLFVAGPISEADIADTEEGEVRTIAAIDGQLFTLTEKHDRHDPGVQKIVVLNRYRQGVKPAVGYVSGFGLTGGAMAASVAHDCHNIVAIGSSDRDIVRAVNEVVVMRGGLAAVCGNEMRSLALPVAGLMSTLDVDSVAAANAEVLRVIESAGCRMHAPLITMSFMCLPVIPQIKITDKGLVSM
ncbi:MAG: adenine deaminase [Bacteroidales bacterium]|nr:adenine deaminase [Bacteroidales bacterium]